MPRASWVVFCQRPGGRLVGGCVTQGPSKPGVLKACGNAETSLSWVSLFPFLPLSSAASVLSETDPPTEQEDV